MKILVVALLAGFVLVWIAAGIITMPANSSLVGLFIVFGTVIFGKRVGLNWSSFLLGIGFGLLMIPLI